MNSSLENPMKSNAQRWPGPAAPEPVPTVHMIALPELSPHADAMAGRPDNAGVSSTAAPVIAAASLGAAMHPLHQVKARLQVCVGEVSVTVGELLAAQEHQVLRLERSLEQPVDLLLEGQVVARGQLVAVDGHFAVRITELPIPLQLSSTP